MNSKFKQQELRIEELITSSVEDYKYSNEDMELFELNTENIFHFHRRILHLRRLQQEIRGLVR